MAALTIRLPDDKHMRLKALAQNRGTPLNKLFDEIATQMLVEFDAEARFKLRVARGAGSVKRGLELLKKAAGE
jgi:predicted DNA-binding protein